MDEEAKHVWVAYFKGRELRTASLTPLSVTEKQIKVKRDDAFEFRAILDPKRVHWSEADALAALLKSTQRAYDDTQFRLGELADELRQLNHVVKTPKT